QAGPSRVEDEPGLPDRRRGLALAARRQVPRDRRALQPAVRPVADRAQRGADPRLAVEGRPAVGNGAAAAQGERALSEIVEYLARRLVDEPDAVRVEELKREGAIILQLHVAPDDVG